MTARRRPLLLASAGATLLLPACLSFPVQPVAIAPPEVRDKSTDAAKQPPKDKFAELPSRPGAKVAIHTTGKDAKTAKDTSTSHHQAEIVGPKAPPKSDEVVKAGNPPSPSPLPDLRPPATPEQPLLEIVRAHLERRPERAIELLKALGPANQEFVLAILPALARGATADLASDPTATALLADELRAAATRLAPRSALVVENVALCRKVDGFGRYEPWPAGQPYRPNDQAQLYLEVRNLVSQPATGPRGETHVTYVRAAVEIHDAHGKRVDQPDRDNWRNRVPVVRFEERKYTRGAVEDFHVLYGFVVPPAPGVYTVTVELRDPAGRRTVKTEPVRFDVAAGP
jgi:hypothetical protein